MAEFPQQSSSQEELEEFTDDSEVSGGQATIQEALEHMTETEGIPPSVPPSVPTAEVGETAAAQPQDTVPEGAADNQQSQAGEEKKGFSEAALGQMTGVFRKMIHSDEWKESHPNVGRLFWKCREFISLLEIEVFLKKKVS